MDSTISLKNWPDENDFRHVIKGILNNIGFSSLETTYDLTSYRECDDQLDAWWIKDTEANEDLFHIILDNSLRLHTETTHPHPALEWVIEQVCHHLGARDDTISGEKYPERTYLEWCKANWVGISTPEAFEKRFQGEHQKYRVPALDPMYSEI